MSFDINIPEVVAEVTEVHDRYERALTTNDLDTLDSLFWNSGLTLRYGPNGTLLGHVFAAMVAGALDHRGRAGVAHREALAGDATEIAFAGDRAVQHGVADDDRLLGHDAGVAWRSDHDAPTR